MDRGGELSRREFLKISGLFAGCLTIASTPFLTGCGFPAASEIDINAYSLDRDLVTVSLDRASQLSEVGGSAAIINDSNQIRLIIARVAQNEFVVALNECPHREKLLGYDHSAGCFICASGKSKFRLDGSIVAGPAENPLRIYQSSLEGNRITIDLRNE